MRNQPPMTILHVAAPAEAGGLESVVLELGAGLSARGHRVVLAAVVETRATADGVLRRAGALGIEVHRVVVPRRAYVQEYRALLRLIGELRPAVVHTHGYRADLVGGLATRRAGVPWVTTAHGFTGGGARARLYEWLQIRSFRRASRVIAVSRPVRDRLERAGVRCGRIEFLANAWAPKTPLARADARRRLGVTGEVFLVGWVGRLTSEKGADVFVKALSGLQGLPWSAAVIGEGADRPALERQAESLGLGNRIRWHGLLPDAAALYPAFDAWVLSSRTEGTPIALFEAMAANVPAVVTAVGGVPDVVSSAEALLVPPEHPEALAAALRAIRTDPEGAAVRAEAASHRLRTRFAPGPWLDSHLALYRAAADQR